MVTAEWIHGRQPSDCHLIVTPRTLRVDARSMCGLTGKDATDGDGGFCAPSPVEYHVYKHMRSTVWLLVVLREAGCGPLPYLAREEDFPVSHTCPMTHFSIS